MSTTKLKTIDEIMEGKVPGSVKVRNPEWPPDALFIPYYRIASENRWYGADNVGVSCGFRGDTPGYEVVPHKTAHYQWLMRSREPWMTREWHLTQFNEGYEICYIDNERMAHSVPLETGDVGVTTNIELARHLVRLHNAILRG